VASAIARRMKLGLPSIFLPPLPFAQGRLRNLHLILIQRFRRKSIAILAHREPQAGIDAQGTSYSRVVAGP
jgi:hypothetical protein